MDAPPLLDLSGENRLYLMLAAPERVNRMNLAVVKTILARDCTPIIVTVNQPYRVLVKSFVREGIPPDRIYVIDAVTQYSGGSCEPGPNVRYVTNPANLTDLGIAITEIIRQVPGARTCVVFDSVSMLLIHIPSATASKFLHFVVNKLKLSEIAGIFLSVEKGLDPVILSQMSAFVDRIIDYGDGEPAGGPVPAGLR